MTNLLLIFTNEFHKEQMRGKIGSNQEKERLKSLKRKY